MSGRYRDSGPTGVFRRGLPVPPEREIKERRRETVPASCTLNERDAVIVTLTWPRETRYTVRCRAASTSSDGRIMATRHVARFTAYLKAYDAAEAWAYRGETPKGDADAC